MRYNLYFDMAAAAVTAVIMIAAIVSRWIPTERNVAYRNLVGTIFLTALFDYVTCMLEMGGRPSWYYGAKLFLDSGYHFFHVMSGAMFLRFTFLLLNLNIHDRRTQAVMYLPHSLIAGLLAINLFFPVVFSYTKEGVYQRGPMIILIYLVGFYYLCSVVYTIIRHREAASGRMTRTMTFYVLMCMGGIILQTVEPSFMVGEFMNALSLVLLYLNVDQADEIKDDRFGILTRRAAMDIAAQTVKAGGSAHVIFVRVSEAQILTTGVEHIRMDVMRQIADYLKKFKKECWISVRDDTCFVLQMKMPDKEREQKILEDIDERFHKPWIIDQDSLMLGVSLWPVRCPEDVSSIQELAKKMNLILPLAGRSQRRIASIEDIDYQKLEWKKQMMERIPGALNARTIEVRYEPVLDLSDGRIVAARAVCFFPDDDGTMVNGNDFIDTAGDEMLLSRLDEYALSDASAQQRPMQKSTGITQQATRLAYAEIMSPRFEERLKRICERHNADYRNILLRISEGTYSRLNEESLKRIDEMQKDGWQIAVDDYGIGESFLSRMIESNLKRLILHSEMSESILNTAEGKIFGSGIISMMHDMNKTVTMTGIKTAEQAKTAKEIGVDCICGSYLTEPLPPREFEEWAAKGGFADEIQ